MKDLVDYLNIAQDLIDRNYVQDVDVIRLAEILRDRDELKNTLDRKIKNE